MAYPNVQTSSTKVWELAARQHGVVARAQLISLGYRPQAIKRRVASGRLHPVWRGVYAVGRPQLGRHGLWMAAVLTCGPGAALSDGSAGALLGIVRDSRVIDVTVPASVARRGRVGIAIHRRATLAAEDVTDHLGIPVTSAIRTLVDLASRLEDERLERAIGEADKLDLIDPAGLRRELERFVAQPGVARLRETLDRHTFTLTESELERRFLRLALRAGLPLPLTQEHLNGFRVDFYWPELRLVVETDGLRYHRTPGQQARDRLRDQAHTAAGITPLRFTHAQVRHDSERVRRTLAAVAARLRAAA